MISKQNVSKALDVQLAISQPMMDALEEWTLIYQNESPWLTEDIKSLNLGATIAAEIAKAATIEMVVEFDEGKRAAYLKQQFEKVMHNIRQYLEYGVAKGGLIFKPYVDGKDIAVDYVQANQFYPVAFDAKGNITKVVFIDQKRIGDKIYTRLEYHAMEEKGCRIINKAFKSDNEDTLGYEIQLKEIEDWASLEPDALIANVDRPLFAYFRYPMANNVDTTSPLGISCFARAIDLLEQADIMYSNLLWEFESGQRALYVDVLAFGKDDDGNPILPNKRLYKTLDTAGTDDAFYKEWTPPLRDTNILNGLDNILKKIEYTCGLAYGTISDPATVARTATEIKITRQQTYATIVDTQKALQKALEQLLWAMDVWATMYKLAPKGTYEVAFQFDDSLIVDREKQFSQDLILVGQGIMGKIEFRMRNFNESETIATQRIEEAQEKQKEEQDLFGGNDEDKE